VFGMRRLGKLVRRLWKWVGMKYLGERWGSQPRRPSCLDHWQGNWELRPKINGGYATAQQASMNSADRNGIQADPTDDALI
jgi:hypothetical protein